MGLAKNNGHKQDNFILFFPMYVCLGVYYILEMLAKPFLFIWLKLSYALYNNVNRDIDVEVIGDGDIIVSQYPSKNITVTKGSKVFLKTNGSNIKIPNFKGWSKKDVLTYLKQANVKYTTEGNGYLISQNLTDVLYDGNTILELKFKEKYSE